MPFVANTPESLLGRSDSKDPASTCRGITSSGRPCRRPVPRAAAARLAPRRPAARPDAADESLLYCWQHKDQAGRSAHSSPGPAPRPQPIPEQRSSLDTLADRLGLVDLPPAAEQKHDKPSAVQTVRPKPKPKPKPTPKHRLRFCFCFTIPIDEVHDSPPPKPRPRPRPPQQQAPSVSVPSAAVAGRHQRISGSASSPSKHPGAASPTARFKHLIPDSLDAATASSLMAELCRPFAEAEEAGYIYMFWLTPASRRDAPSPPVAAARSLLAPPSPARGPDAARSRRPSDVVSRFADASDAGKMLLKIGRAANVQRRMNQWQRQCGHDIEMLRYYPYLPGAGDAPANGPTPRMTPHCRRVERLIHVELAGLGLRASLATCAACGRDHREWFQVEATREAVRRVDEVIRRWVDWDETVAD